MKNKQKAFQPIRIFAHYFLNQLKRLSFTVVVVAVVVVDDDELDVVSLLFFLNKITFIKSFS